MLPACQLKITLDFRIVHKGPLIIETKVTLEVTASFHLFTEKLLLVELIVYMEFIDKFNSRLDTVEENDLEDRSEETT